MSGVGRKLHGRWWGWHRLADRWASRLVADAGIRRGDLVLDIGAGDGAITGVLVEAGARVIAVEHHPDRVETLRRRFGRSATVVRADASDLRLPRRSFQVVANPPFAISTALMKRLLAPGSRLQSAHLVVPRHVAERWTGARAPGRQRWGRTWDAAITASVPRSAFRPEPPRGAVVLRLSRRRGAGRAR